MVSKNILTSQNILSALINWDGSQEILDLSGINHQTGPTILIGIIKNHLTKFKNQNNQRNNNNNQNNNSNNNNNISKVSWIKKLVGYELDYFKNQCTEQLGNFACVSGDLELVKYFYDLGNPNFFTLKEAILNCLQYNNNFEVIEFIYNVVFPHSRSSDQEDEQYTYPHLASASIITNGTSIPLRHALMIECRFSNLRLYLPFTKSFEQLQNNGSFRHIQNYWKNDYAMHLMNNNNDGEIPIVDIPGAKILDWLVERKKVPMHWKRNNGNLIKLIEDTMTSNPSQLLKDLKIENIDYFKCLEVFKYFESQPSGNSKTLLGYYSNINTQKWNDVIKAYHKDQLYIGENCQRLTQSLNYDIPNMKKTIEKTMKSLEESNKKEIELTKSRETAINTFKKACSDIGIKGDKIRDEILELPNGLDKLFEKAIQLLQDGRILGMIRFYKQFAQTNTCELKEEIFSYLLLVNKHGNISIGEREMILNPSIIVKSKKDQNVDSNNSGSDLVALTAPATIDWDFSVEESGSQLDEKAAASINWDEFTVVLEEDGTTNSSSVADDFSMMDTIEIVEEANTISSPILESTTTITDNIKFMDNANESIMSDKIFRNRLLDDIYEMDIFLKQRAVEMNQPESEFSAIHMMQESITLDQCEQYSKLIGDIISQLSSSKVNNILELKSSSKLVDRMALQFTQKIGTITKYQQLIKDLLQKREDLNTTLTETKTKLESQTKETKQLRLQLQELLVDIMDGKHINIMMPYILS
ncbi:DUF733 family protein [Cavenderia fasciculata]|uniref:DUF733 family protein n=1 Tax=Cavenderia fasciculata TaxID=261658 RepID=F4PZV4_CACFS|nr:DUF733 family protein [Cavenderia fasciculata]EGG18868.1 DUF733 family protein [Cavenderia fasciculata]|eukprot:XP_004357330.1 DUF733 family protein [Cavenderia fasciculata]